MKTTIEKKINIENGIRREYIAETNYSDKGEIIYQHVLITEESVGAENTAPESRKERDHDDYDDYDDYDDDLPVSFLEKVANSIGNFLASAPKQN